MTNEAFIRQHREEDVRKLALGKVPEGVDVRWCLQQIEGWQLARKKLPTWAKTEGLWYPVRLSLEQCSSEETARYKRQLAERLLSEGKRQSMVDLTGGLGVDFSFLAPLFKDATYVEILPELRELAQHNMPLLGLPNATIAEPTHSSLFTFHSSLIYIDPARRDGVGRKTVGIEDCTPNLLEMQDALLQQSQYVLVKLSPMLDITEALRQLHCVSEVHVVSVRGECKELLMVMGAPSSSPQWGSAFPPYPSSSPDVEDMQVPNIYCVNLGTEEDLITTKGQKAKDMGKDFSPLTLAHSHFLYEPNASILKAGVQDVLCERYSVRKLHPMSHLFVGDDLIPRFPGRCFRIEAWSDFSKKALKELIGDVRRANLAVRNFPTSVEKLRRQLRLAEGGDVYLFATTLADGTHALIKTFKV